MSLLTLFQLNLESAGGHIGTINQATESDSAQAFARRKTVALGQVAETDQLNGIGSIKHRTIGLTAETDFPQPISSSSNKIILIGQSSESDTAQSITHAKSQTIGQSTESNLGIALTAVKFRALGIPIESDVANAISRQKAKPITQITEIMLAQSVQWAPKRRLLGPVTELDAAQAITVQGGDRLVKIVRSTLHVNELVSVDLTL